MPSSCLWMDPSLMEFKDNYYKLHLLFFVNRSNLFSCHLIRSLIILLIKEVRLLFHGHSDSTQFYYPLLIRRTYTVLQLQKFQQLFFFLSIEVNFIYTKGITFSLSLFNTYMLYLYTVTVNVCWFWLQYIVLSIMSARSECFFFCCFPFSVVSQL